MEESSFCVTPHDEILPVLQVLLNSKLPTDVLGRIWDLSDIDKDGYLDKDEFAVVSGSTQLPFS